MIVNVERKDTVEPHLNLNFYKIDSQDFGPPRWAIYTFGELYWTGTVGDLDIIEFATEIGIGFTYTELTEANFAPIRKDDKDCFVFPTSEKKLNKLIDDN
ncbi:MAG: hypothetical protein ACK5QX_03825 [bacterium]|jgi:hypothetical protein